MLFKYSGKYVNIYFNMKITFVRLSKFFSDRYAESRPLSSPSLPPRCGFESLFAYTELRGPLVHIFGYIRE